MNKEQIKKFKEIIEDIEKGYTDFNDSIIYFMDEEDLKDIEDIDELKNLVEELDQNGDLTDTEIIYYGNAIEYLKENDASLNESLSLASEMGYTLDNISSETLASLLISQNNKEDFSCFCDEVYLKCESIFEEVEECYICGFSFSDGRDLNKHEHVCKEVQE